MLSKKSSKNDFLFYYNTKNDSLTFFSTNINLLVVGGFMRISIFQLKQDEPFRNEYNKMMKILLSKCISFDKKEYTYFDFVNHYLFHNWKYRGTYIDCYEYLNNIGVNIKTKKISKESFLNLLEFLSNMQLLISNLKYYKDNIKYSVKCKSILNHNIPILLDSLGYQAYQIDEKIIIQDKSIQYENLMELLPNDDKELLLAYKNIHNTGIKMKRLILHKIYERFIKDSEKYKNYNSPIYTSIKIVILKMGVIGEIDKKYMNLSNYKLKKYYDYCYEMILYLLETENILRYKDEIKNT